MASDEIFNKELKSLHEILNQGDIEEVRKLKLSKVFLSLLPSYNVELISSISTWLNDICLFKCPNTIKCYEEMLNFILEESNPEDLFVTLLEQLDEENCCVEKFVTLLSPLKFSLLKVSTRGHWLEWTLSTVKCYLESIHFPEDHEIEFGEKKMTVNDHHVDTVLKLSEKLLEFYETFLMDTLSPREKDAVIVFGFHALAQPMMYIYLEKFDKLRQICDQILLSIDKLYGKGYCLFDFVDETKAIDLEELENELSSCELDDDLEQAMHHPLWDKIRILPLAVYYSVLIIDVPFTKYFPHVYCPMYMFHKLLYLSVVLMRHQHNAVIRKGLLLCHQIFRSIPNGTIPYQYLEYNVHKKFVKSVSQVSIYSYILENRKLAIELLQMYVHKFDSKGSYFLLLNITSETGSDDIDSEIITIFRNSMHKAFLENNFQYYQKGKYLIDLLKVFAKLDENSGTDLMVSKNKIVSLLYLFALILRRDVHNQTAVRDHLNYFERKYFTTVKKAVEKSREKYKRDAVTFINEADQIPIEDDISIMVEGESLPKLQRIDKINATRNALNALNMIDHAMELVCEYTN